MSRLNEKFLYKRDSKGKIRQWNGWVEAGQSGRWLMYVETGLLDGNKVKNRPKIYYAGKQNRDAKGQAIFELESKINKKRDEGYFDTIQEAQDTLVILPMLALDFNIRSHNIDYPAIGQRKFDGVRSMASINPDGSVSLKSRKGKEFPHMNHLRQQVASLKGIPDGAFLDGELYSDTLTFQEVVGLVRRESLKAGDEDKLKQISYRLYDMLDPNNRDAGFQDRYDTLKTILGSTPPKNLILTKNFEINDKAEVKPLHDQFVKEGYEGIMIRNKDGEYGINKRSKNLQKFKEFYDQEFQIVGYEEGTGNDAGTVIWVCMTEQGDLFKARPKGTREERTEYFQKGDDFIGATLTVRYFEMTDDGIPRFPVGVAIRNYE
jgi:ATP-dependent DNA ligase